MLKTKEICLDLRKRIVDAQKAGDGYKVPTAFPSVKNWSEKYHKETHTVHNKTGRGGKPKISKILESRKTSKICV